MTVVQFRKTGTGRALRAVSLSETSASMQPPEGVKAIGIDLGTTNSVVSIYRENQTQPETLLYDNTALVPSMFFWNQETNSEIVGLKAKQKLEVHPHEIIRSTKRSMGTTTQTFTSFGRQYTAEQSAQVVLQYLASHPELQTEIQTHGEVWAVVTVPAHFDDAARQATIAAAKSSKIRVMRIVNEPTAAALAYSMLPDVRDESQENLAVFDLGGGTFDVSVVEREGFVFNVLSSEGDVNLGGDDFDEALAKHLIDHVQPRLVARRATQESELFRKLIWHAEQAKIHFQSNGVATVLDSDIDGKGSNIDVSIMRDEFEKLASPFIQRTLDLTERAMQAARLRPNRISRILLVGGSTRVSLVHKMLQSYFPPCIVDARLEPDLAVSWGAAAQAAIILGLEPSTILVDVCSHTLGIGVAEDGDAVNANFRRVAKEFGIKTDINDQQLQRLLGDRIDEFNLALQKLLRVAPIIHRNSPLPARKSEFFSTLYKNQIAVHVVVVQGEAESVGENRMIGSFLFNLEQPCDAGSRCEIQLTYDVNGMVHVLARQLGTQNESEAQFDSRTGQVIGWVSLKDTELNSVATHQLADLRFNTESTASVLSLSEERMRKNKNNSIAEVSNAPAAQNSDVINAIVLRARRALKKLGAGSEQFIKIDALLTQYGNLLAAAKLGAKNENILENIEGKLIEILDELSL